MGKSNIETRLRPFVTFLICFILMGVVAINKTDKLFGITFHKDDKEQTIVPVMENQDGTTIINTTEIGKNIIGYSGPVPVEIFLRGGKIERITVLQNGETPEYIGAVINSDLLDSWQGKTLEEASKYHPDGVTGATFSSSAVIKNIEAGINYALDNPVETNEEGVIKLDFKFFCVIAIILIASIIPLFIKNQKYRIFQLTLNVLLLGFWGGTFISYSLMTSLMANGITSWLQIPMLLMIVSAFFFPFFKKINYYCNWICPYGSLQELLGKPIKYKIHLSAGLVKWLGYFRNALWFCLMVVMWAGLWFDWMDWEPFAAFFFTDVSVVTLSIAGAFLVLSLFIQRPYCRFVCPTGTLFKLSEGTH